MTHAARVALFSVESICDFVCLFVCQHGNSWTATDVITKFAENHPMFKRADKFEIFITIFYDVIT